MLSEEKYQNRLDRIQALRDQVTERLSGSRVSSPALAEELNRQIDALVDGRRERRPATRPGSRRTGRGRAAGAKGFGKVKIPPPGVAPYDENANSERIVAVGDLYYIYQHERTSVRLRPRARRRQSWPKTDYHMLFAHFVSQVTLFWRDKRISDVIRERAIDPSFGSTPSYAARGSTSATT